MFAAARTPGEHMKGLCVANSELEIGTMVAVQEIGTAVELLNCPRCGSRMPEGPKPFTRIFGDIRAFECSACGYTQILEYPFKPMLADEAVGSRPKIPFGYLFGIVLAALLTAAVLLFVLDVQTGFIRKEILGGTLAAAAIGVFLALVFFRRRRRS